MDSDIFSEEDSFSVNVYSQIKCLNNNSLTKLIEEAINNRNIKDATPLVFQMFHNILAISIHNRILDEEYHELKTLEKYINILREMNKFDCHIFVDYLFEQFLILPVEIIWWLHKNEILYFSQYCDILKPVNIANDLIELIKANKQHNIFIIQQIMEDLFLELIRIYYRPNPGICRLYRSKIWSDFCFTVLNDLIDETINTALNENTNAAFVNILQYMSSSKRSLPYIIIKQFYTNILNKIIIHNVNEYDIYSSYIYQQLWCSNKINNSLLLLYEEIFEKYCSIQDVLKIMNEYEDKINWKFTLAAVGVCVKKSPTGIADVKGITMNFLEESFKGGKVDCFVKAFLFARQNYLESSMDDYRSWYSTTLGSNSTFKTTSNPTLFKFVINALISLIPYEPKLFLKVHISLGIAAPPKCNSLVFDYKTLCRARLEELKQTPCILVGREEITALHLIEDNARKNIVNPILNSIIRTRYEEFFNTLLPQILRNRMPFTKVKQLLLTQQLITDEMIHFGHVDPEGKIFEDDDDEDTFVSKK